MATPANHPGDPAAPSGTVRVRFAPSPTGYLHIGGVRTALFNYLFARRHRGAFILRIEDTDRERSTPEAVQAILDGLRYLGLEWDEGPEVGGPRGPYFQSERAPRHRAFVESLLERGKAYHCFCSRERLEELRASQRQRQERLLYDRRCLDLPREEAASRLAAGEPSVVRFRVPPGATALDDLVRGRVVFRNEELEDLVIRRTDGSCVYNLAVAADDHEMGITHVIRGEDHLSNTPKQVLILEALGLPVPRYAHIPLILGPGGGKLSKRHGAVSVTEYQRRGYLPEAMVNFLARLGWSYDDRQEIFSLEELVEKFSLAGVSRAGAVYDPRKLEHLGGHYLRQRPLAEVVDLAVPYLVRAGWVSPGDAAPGGSARLRLERMAALEQPRSSHLEELAGKVRFYFHDPEAPDEAGAKVLRRNPNAAALVARYARDLEARFPGAGWGLEATGDLDEHLRAFCAGAGVKLSEVAQPVRILLTGRAASPGLFEIMALLGREAVLRRLGRAGDWFVRAAAG